MKIKLELTAEELELTGYSEVDFLTLEPYVILADLIELIDCEEFQAEVIE